MARIYIESDDELPELAEVLRPKQSKSTATRSPSKPVRKTTKKDGASAKEESTSSRPIQRALRKVENNTKLLGPFNGGIAVKELKPSSRTNSRLSPQKPKKVIEPLEIEVEICEEEEDVICASADDSDFQSNGSLLDDEQDEKPSSFKPRSIPQSPLQKFMDARPKEKAKPNASSTLPPPSNPSYDLSNPFLGPRIALPALSSQPTTYSSRPTSSSPAFYNDAVLTYEPAKRLSPSKIMLPSKSPSRPSTPPAAPPSPSKKLNSPSKSRFAAIPKAPVHESIDAFWSQDVINDWNEQYSPKKIMTSPRKKRFATPPLSGEEREDPPSPSTSPRKGIPRKVGMSPEKRMARDAKRSFEATKHEIAGRFLRELDDTISEGQIAKLSESTGGIRIDWSNRLLSTAGRANWRKECIKKQLPNGTVEKTYKHTAYIELATKVIDNEERLINVLAHEFCHLCTFMISEVRNNPHGKEFKSWARKCSRAFEDRNVEVTTKHSYEIDYSFIWECVDCSIEYKRHSKSINPEKSGCGSCKGRLVQTKPVPRGNAGAKPSEYQIFFKENHKRVKDENPGANAAAVMGIIGKMWREKKEKDSNGVEETNGVARKEKQADRSLDMDAIVRELEVITIDD